MPPPRLPQKSSKAITFRLEGVTYRFDMGSLKGSQERALWTDAGITVNDALQALQRGALFGVAAVMFLARLQAGETVSYATVEADLDRAWTENNGDISAELVVEDDDTAGPFGEQPESS